MGILKAVWSWFTGLFGAKEKIGIIFVLLFASGCSGVAAEIANKENQKKALEFVRELNERTDLTNAAKAVIFNKKMLEYGKKLGKVFCESVINCLRELAVNAAKAERGK